MSVSSKPRKRAVRLTDEALAQLKMAMDDRWRGQSTGRLTREARAELLGVSIATADKILTNRGVDRTTLEVAFKSLDIAWSDAFCHRLIEPSSTEEQSKPTKPHSPSPPEKANQGLPWRRVSVLAGVGGTLILALLAARNVGPSAKPAQSVPWRVVYDRYVYDSLQRYNAADYPGSRRAIEAAFDLAKRHNAGREMAGPLHRLGELDEVQGHLQDAKIHYQTALDLRRTFGDKDAEGALYESIGLVETRLKEFASAERTLRLALKSWQAAKNQEGVALASRDLGILFRKKGEIDAADRWLANSLVHLKGLGKPATEADVRGERALLRLARGEVKDAKEDLEACLDYWKGEGHPRWIAVFELRLGQVEERLGNHAAARARFTRSKAGFEKVGDAVQAAEAANHLRELVTRIP